MRIRKLIASLAVACSPAFAAAPYDGIYQVAAGEWLTVLEKNGTVLVAYYYSNPNTNSLQWNFVTGQRFTSPRIDNWDLLSGPLSNGVATVTGESVFAACNMTLQLNFAALTARLVQLVPTPYGAAQAIDCLALYNYLVNVHGGSTYKMSKVW